MHCVRKITQDISWIGGNDRRLALFESAYPVPKGVSYNSYLLLDEKTVLLDTVDRSITDQFFENLDYVLNGRALDYVVVHHMEPDHAATLRDLLARRPNVTVVGNQKTLTMFAQFFGETPANTLVVKEGDTLPLGRHTLTFCMAPMVHWPEVMVSYDSADKVLFSADAFGSFGALDGALFADQVDYDRDWLDEARRYYVNIVGKYGPQVTAALKKLEALDIQVICPLHGLVWRKNLDYILEKHRLWASYTPEKRGVAIAYASVYGNTQNAAEILAAKLADKGVPVVMFDASMTHYSEILAAFFQYSHIVLASTTYNNGIFTSMEHLLHEMGSHNLQKRKVALIQNGSWAPASGKLMAQLLSPMKEVEVLSPVTLKSSLTDGQEAELEALAEALLSDGTTEAEKPAEEPASGTKKWVCKICGYVYEGESLPEDFVCPICRRPASDFEPMQ